jgi:hypothetical protein
MRFSKNNLIERLEHQIDGLEKTFKFDPNNGTSQIEDNDFLRAYAFGHYTALRDIVEMINNGL